ncbi:MAG TPA: phosphoglucosamine mutase [Porticoccaceae bacterium]|nr:phosphoglucosamine mutase [Porticoccaceae bacterium]
MTKRFFGTDGVRGQVGTYPITAEFVLKLGWAAGKVFGNTRASAGRNLILVGKDTRVSGYMFESALQAGIIAAGVDVSLMGPMPTPAVAYLTRTFRAQAGIVISASHNPFHDNGIKFFGGDGFKLPDDVEHRIERFLDEAIITAESVDLGRAHRVTDAAGRYVEFCKGTLPYGFSLAGMKLVVDCAHGATYHVAPDVLRELGASVIELGVQPDGFNINEGCGSTNPELLRQRVIESGADVGIALDGDGDRVIFVDQKGELVDGDELLFIIAKSRQGRGAGCNGVAGTLMSNFGLERAMTELGVPFVRTAVGDRYVIEAMRERRWNLGGENSGHIVCGDLTTTGDGIVAALQVLKAMCDSGADLHDLKDGMHKLPQSLVNVRVAEKIDLQHQSITGAVRDAEQKLAGNGRVLLRPSGTEPIVRVMVEGEDVSLVETLAQDIAEVVEAGAS